MNEDDYIRSKRDLPDFALPDSYDDWLDEREGLHIGLSAAGVHVVLITVDLDHFVAWCRDTSTTMDERALDRFATLDIRGMDGLDELAPTGDPILFQPSAPPAYLFH